MYFLFTTFNKPFNLTVAAKSGKVKQSIVLAALLCCCLLLNNMYAFASPPAKLRLLIFYSQTCGYCQRMQQAFQQNPAFEKAMQEEYEIVRIEINSPEGRPLAQQWNVHAVPTLLLDGQTGGPTWIKGFSNLEKLGKALFSEKSVGALTLQQPLQAMLVNQTAQSSPCGVCGNGLKDGNEQCDDGNTINGDGCNSTCQAESGYTCVGSPSSCFIICGDGVKAGNETCDDGNTVSGDGCSAVCQLESGDTDHDGVNNQSDNCPFAPNTNQLDADADGKGDVCDNCPSVVNSTQIDTDGDTLGDACDLDDDNDGVTDGFDNCRLIANTNQANNDGDALGDACDSDDDNDGVNDGCDNCQFVANANQANTDGDALGDACDNCPTVANGTPLLIVTQPVTGSAVYVGATVSATISVTGTNPTYQWYRNGVALTGIASATTASLSLTNVLISNSGSYSAAISNGCNSLTSTAFSLTVNAAPTRLYVKANATGAGTGLSWNDAFVDLQSALNYSASQNLTEIWVAAGVYKPSTSSRNVSFSLKNGVAIYGGFVGNETNLTDRPTINPVSGNPSSSTLSGDLGIADNPADNSLQIIFNSGLNNSAILDGFVITGANSTAGGTGGGMNNQSSSPVITNCSFVNNSSYQYGGAIYNNNSSPVLTNCVFMNNKADFLGGAIYSITGSVGSTLVITNCAFLSNTAVNGGGAAIYNNNATEVITNCSFQGNRGALGRIIYNTLGRVVMTNCALFNNGGVNTFYNPNGSITAAYSLLESTVTGYIDGGNNLTTTTSPFISTTSVALTPCTSAINAGDPATTSATAGNTDLAANPRFFNNGRIDMGAVEFQGAANTPVAFTSPLTSSSALCVGTALSVPTSISGTVSSYQWYKDGNALSSQTSATLSLTNVQTTDQGSYSVVVTGACNSLTSTAFSLTVNATPSVSINPTSATLTSASPSVSLTAIGFGTYLWSTGETSQVISVTSSGIYSVTLTTQGGCTASTSANVPGVDLTVALELPQAQFGTSGTAATGNFLVNVFEVGGLATSSGNVTITITAPVGYTLSFVPTLTSIDVSGGSRVVVNNGVWTVSHSLEARQLSLTMNSGAFIGAGGKSSVGLSLTRTMASSGSTANITVNVADDLTMRYDGNLSNNGYARIISGL